MEVGGAPDIQLARMGAEDVVIGLRAVPLGMAHLADLCSPGPVGRHLAGQAVCRLLQVVRSLDRQPATGCQLRQQSRVELRVIRQPLQRGVGQDQLRCVLGLPVLDIRQLEGHLGQPLMRCAQHVVTAVDTHHPRLWRMSLQYGSGITGAAAQVDGQLDIIARHRRQQIMHRAGTLAFKQGILLGGPTHRITPRFQSRATG